MTASFGTKVPNAGLIGRRLRDRLKGRAAQRSSRTNVRPRPFGELGFMSVVPREIEAATPFHQTSLRIEGVRTKAGVRLFLEGDIDIDAASHLEFVLEGFGDPSQSVVVEISNNSQVSPDALQMIARLRDRLDGLVLHST
jgi:hypothetical protein